MDRNLNAMGVTIVMLALAWMLDRIGFTLLSLVPIAVGLVLTVLGVAGKFNEPKGS